MGSRQTTRRDRLPVWLCATVIALVAGCGPRPSVERTEPFAAESSEWRLYVYGGLPRGPEQLRLLVNRGYVVGYDEGRRNPAWAAYRLFRVDDPPDVPRPSSSAFKMDHRTEAKVKPTDYVRSGYDRGHMAPSYGIGTHYGAEAQLETFLMSNVAPQMPTLNRRVWARLERILARDYANRLEEVWVIIGPIYADQPPSLPSGVTVPKAFFKIIIDEQHGTPRALAFVVPQNVAGSESLEAFLVSINSIEDATGLDFLSDLEDAIEEQIEAATPAELW